MAAQFDGNERPFGTRTVPVRRARHQLLPVPLSPRTRMVESVLATRAIRRTACASAGCARPCCFEIDLGLSSALSPEGAAPQQPARASRPTSAPTTRAVGRVLRPTARREPSRPRGRRPAGRRPSSARLPLTFIDSDRECDSLFRRTLQYAGIDSKPRRCAERAPRRPHCRRPIICAGEHDRSANDIEHEHGQRGIDCRQSMNRTERSAHAQQRIELPPSRVTAVPPLCTSVSSNATSRTGRAAGSGAIANSARGQASARGKITGRGHLVGADDEHESRCELRRAALGRVSSQADR